MPYLSGGIRAGLGTVRVNRPRSIRRSFSARPNEAAPASSPIRSTARSASSCRRASAISRSTRSWRPRRTLRTGQADLGTEGDGRVGEPLKLATTSAAFVYDTSSFGATSPVQGQRYRSKWRPRSVPSITPACSPTTVGTSCRCPFYTIAARVLHYGRYGAGGEDGRLVPLYIGYPTLVRGYDVDTLASSECVPALGCPASTD